MTDIKGFFGDYRFLSNFYPSPIHLLEVSYDTVEHFYQACKAKTTEDHLYVNSAATPGLAKKLGQRIELREDWESIKLNVMGVGVGTKFDQNPELKKKLLETGDAYLEETNYWGDRYWGKCGGIGSNHLGIILMELREKARMEQFYA